MPVTSLQSQQHDSELVSTEVKELISYRPHWIIRRGNAVFFLCLLLVLTLSWVVRYPDLVNGSVRLTGINAPKLLVAKTTGKLEKLLVANDATVTAGQPIAFLQSTAKHAQVLALQQWINKVEPAVLKNELDILVNQPLPVLNELGEMQPGYQEFQQILQEIVQMLANGYYRTKMKNLQQDLQYISDIQGNAKKQQQLLQQDFELQKLEYKAKEKLEKEKVIAPLELNQDKGKIIAKEQGLQQLSAQLINNDIAEHNKRKEILDLQKAMIDQQQQFHYSLLTLKSKVEEWVQQYIVTASVPGKLSYASFLQENQQLSVNQELFYIQTGESRFYGEMMAGQSGFGKIKTGQPVVIKFDGYPSSEFGYMMGKIGYITSIPGPRDSFLIKIELPNTLSTNYGKTIHFTNSLLARAEVITDDRRLFDRFLGQLKDVLHR